MQPHGDPVDPARQIRDTVSAEQLFKAAATMHTVLGNQGVLPVGTCGMWILLQLSKDYI